MANPPCVEDKHQHCWHTAEDPEATYDHGVLRITQRCCLCGFYRQETMHLEGDPARHGPYHPGARQRET